MIAEYLALLTVGDGFGIIKAMLFCRQTVVSEKTTAHRPCPQWSAFSIAMGFIWRRLGRRNRWLLHQHGVDTAAVDAATEQSRDGVGRGVEPIEVPSGRSARKLQDR